MKNDFDTYQNEVWNSGYPREIAIPYCALKLNGEAGEVAEKIGKTYRDHGGVFTDERKRAILLELGDTLWYIQALAKELGFTLSEVAEANKQKVLSRLARGTLHGEGDNR